MRALLFCLALTLAACDSANPAPDITPTPASPATPPAETARSFRFANVPASITVDVPDTRVLAFSDLFGSALPAGFRATTTFENTTASVLLTSHLTVRALSEGTATLRVHVAAPGYRDTTLTFALVSRVQCPPAAAPGAADFFPVEAGRTGGFQYESYANNFSLQESQQTNGVLAYEVRNVSSCYRGTRTFDLAYTFSGTVTAHRVDYPSSGVTTALSSSPRVTASEDSTNTVRFAIPGISTWFHDVPVEVQRYGTAGETERTVQYSHPNSNLTCTSTVRFDAGVGLTGEQMASCYYAYHTFASRTLLVSPGL